MPSSKPNDETVFTPVDPRCEQLRSALYVIWVNSYKQTAAARKRERKAVTELLTTMIGRKPTEYEIAHALDYC